MNRRTAFSLAALAVIGLVLWLATRGSQQSQEGIKSPPTQKAVENHQRIASPADPSVATKASRFMPDAKEDIARLLNEALLTLRQGDPTAIARTLEKLNSVLGGRLKNPDAAIAAIAAFLRSGQDASTGGPFRVGPGGALSESTTLRVYLMDKLGLLSRGTNGTAALEIARETLQDFGSADEWAVSMRNIAWLDPASRDFLEERVTTMLHHPAWREEPSTGMLEAFDLIVHTGALGTVPELGRLITARNSPLARASAVALDRLATSQPLALATLMNEQPALLSEIPLTRADLFARADPAIPAQREEIESYLLRSDISPREYQKFFSSLIQTGGFISHNLVTPFIPPESPADAVTRLATLSKTANQWLREERFQRLNTELTHFSATLNRISEEIAHDADESK